MNYEQPWKLAAQLFCWTLMLIPGAVLSASMLQQLSFTNIPPADEKSLIFAATNPRIAKSTYDDWLDACYWIRVSTDADSLWLTPRNQQTFKWNAQRAEVVCWKDSPQNAKDLLEWYRRIHAVFGADENGAPKPMNLVRAINLSREFKFDYILSDKRSDPTPLTLPIVYENDTFAIFQMLQL